MILRSQRRDDHALLTVLWSTILPEGQKCEDQLLVDKELGHNQQNDSLAQECALKILQPDQIFGIQ